MIVKTHYSNGRIDVFDTSSIAYINGQPEYTLANYTLELSQTGNIGLWLCTYYYETTEAYRKAEGSRGLPAARRRDGWSYLLADSRDMELLEKVTVDGDIIWIRFGEGLICGSFVETNRERRMTFAPEIIAFNRQCVLSDEDASRGRAAGIDFTAYQLANVMASDSFAHVYPNYANRYKNDN